MSTATNVQQLAAETPATRDRYVDLVRAVSIGVVVFGHWLMAIVYLRGGSLSGTNALDVVPGLWILTWVLQVMPLFFMVGGFSNLTSWRSSRERGDAYGNYLRTRTARLMRPTVVFIATWTAIATTVRILDPDLYSSMALATRVLAIPLWFLAVYILVVALAPLMVRCHERWPVGTLVVLAAAAVLADAARIAGGLTIVGYMNLGFVWLFAHQLGFHYADGRMIHWPRRVFAAVAVSSLAILAVLTGSGIYSPSMVRMTSDAASNNSPPTVCLILLSLWLGSAAMLARPAATRWLERPRVWLGVVVANSFIMTVYLWHMTALLVGVLLLYPLGFPQPSGGSTLWWAWRPVWMMALALILAGFVATFSRFERPRPRAQSTASTSRLTVGLGVIALVVGLAGVAGSGFATSAATTASTRPLLYAVLVTVGYGALARRRIGG